MVKEILLICEFVKFGFKFYMFQIGLTQLKINHELALLRNFKLLEMRFKIWNNVMPNNYVILK